MIKKIDTTTHTSTQEPMWSALLLKKRRNLIYIYIYIFTSKHSQAERDREKDVKFN